MPLLYTEGAIHMNRKTLFTLAVLFISSAGLLSTGLSLASTDASSGKAKASEQGVIKTSDNAAITMRNVHGARLAIFDGSPDKALTYVDAAVTRVEAAKKDADNLAIKPEDKTRAADEYVPFDAILTVAEGFVPTKKKLEHINKANQHFKRGEKKEALETLKLGDVDVSVTTQLVPVQFAEARIKGAEKLMNEGKYYEANLQLKAVEDSVLIETLAVDGTPKDKGKS
jgi:hypothetical protein